MTTTEGEAQSSTMTNTNTVASDSTSSNSPNPKKARTSSSGKSSQTQKPNANCTKIKGVVPQQNGNYGAQIYATQNRIWLGTFKTAEDAAKAYDIAAMKLRRGNNNDANNRNFQWGDKFQLELEFIEQSSQEALLNMIKDGIYETKFVEFLRSKAQAGTSQGNSGDIQVNKEGCMPEELFRKELTPSDVGKLNRLVIPKRYAQKCFTDDKSVASVGPSLAEEDTELTFYDRSMKDWKFRYCYWKSSQSYVFTRGWNKFVKEKDLKAKDTVVFYEGKMHDNSGNEVSRIHLIDIVRNQEAEPLEREFDIVRNAEAEPLQREFDIVTDNDHIGSEIPRTTPTQISITSDVLTLGQDPNSGDKVVETRAACQVDAPAVENDSATKPKSFRLFDAPAAENDCATKPKSFRLFGVEIDL